MILSGQNTHTAQVTSLWNHGKMIPANVGRWEDVWCTKLKKVLRRLLKRG